MSNTPIVYNHESVITKKIGSADAKSYSTSYVGDFERPSIASLGGFRIDALEIGDSIACSSFADNFGSVIGNLNILVFVYLTKFNGNTAEFSLLNGQQLLHAALHFEEHLV